VVELLRKALEWQALLASGEVLNQAAIARREGITRARVTQVMGLLRLAPEIQQQVLSLPDAVRRPAITERALRPIAQFPQERDQLHAFQQLLTGSGAAAHASY
jgi:ParB-like chromosome segregation protein Spo0J